jgi:hypothetical protein
MQIKPAAKAYHKYKEYECRGCGLVVAIPNLDPYFAAWLVTDAGSQEHSVLCFASMAIAS